MRDDYAISVKFLEQLQVTYRVPLFFFFMVESSEEPMAAGPFSLLIQFAFELWEFMFQNTLDKEAQSIWI